MNRPVSAPVSGPGSTRVTRRVGTAAAVGRAARSELVRTRRKGLLLAWFGLTAAFAVLIDLAMFRIVADATGPATDGPGVSFPSLAVLESADGLTAGASAAASFFGVITLCLWAVVTAGDYSSGLIRLLVSAEPRRWRLLVGKALVLAGWTAAACAVAVAVVAVVAPVAARSAGVDTSAWGQDLVPVVLGTWLDLYLALLAWGTIGLVIAVVTRSSVVAISAGIGYVLLVEAVLVMTVKGLADRLPGATLTALANGGDEVLSYASALALAAVYAAVGLAVALVVFTRRDITD